MREGNRERGAGKSEMKTLYIERSTGECRDGKWVEELDLEGVGRIVVGTGPGSFAGIRSALAFAQGYALGTKCEVLGLPSACALAGEGRLAVVGDARQGKIWIALFNGFNLERDVFQVNESELKGAIPADYVRSGWMRFLERPLGTVISGGGRRRAKAFGALRRRIPPF